MTNHTGHNHPMTPAGRRACRAAAAKATPAAPVKPVVEAPYRRTMPAPLHTFVVRSDVPDGLNHPHCQACGSDDYEDLNHGDQGYTACCNERVVDRCYAEDCYHN